ncbi:MAG: hypothetical protein ACRDJI_03535 [Actinomycetota bacterium]
MNEDDVRKHAEAHGEAMVAGDIRRAGDDLTDEAKAVVGPVMSALPRPVTAAEVQSVEGGGEEYVVRIRYSGADREGEGEKEVVVQSRWAEHDGRPMIVRAEIV